MKNRSDSIIVAALLIFSLLCSSSLAAAVRAELDRSRVIEGETITLTLLTDAAGQSLETDFSALERDFEILDRRSETQLSIVNGRQTAVIRLVLTLEPRAPGNFVIPELTFGNESTGAIRVRVDPAPELEPGAQPPVFIEMEVVPGEGPYYVHAQIGLVVRVFYQQNLTEAAISQPDPSPASVRLMQETPYQAERGGERYRVLERNYAVFPERSGELSIPPMELTGRLVERRANNVWQPAVRGRRVRVESEAMKLMIEPKPVAFSGGEWQPAREYRLTQKISTGEKLRVGEPVTRTVIIDAVGLEENMIVEPVWPELPNARIYPDQPQGITRDDGQWVLGHKEFRYAVVPEQEGDLVLPELRVEWWDTQNGEARMAVLAPYTITVQPSALVPPPAPIVAPGEPVTAVSPGVRAGPGVWRTLAFGFAALWILTLFAAWRISKGKRPEPPLNRSAESVTADSAEALARLEKACKSDDRRQARGALQDWLRTIEGNSSLLEFAASTVDPDLRKSIHALDADGFRPEGGADAPRGWDGQVLWQQFDHWRREKAADSEQNAPPLTDIYAKENRVR
ncbi:MAG: protein BatD [Xanthomonadales bacterium]|nr:BatD family protein [Gammaproteobacteria bacterium]MBT8054219.1 BatD family protein [Gammaproteobacteria bacterium]NND57588.1 protein BatD [Xanthomonadales bacterium]NNK51312.1 protein BatD [Xanthomonadales bacterium]